MISFKGKYISGVLYISYVDGFLMLEVGNFERIVRRCYCVFNLVDLWNVWLVIGYSVEICN